MWWFDKDKRERKEVWDEEIQGSIGDIEAAHIIRDICRSAADSAERTGGVAERQDNKNSNKSNKNTKNNKNKDDKDSKRNAYEADRYERAAKAAMGIAIKIADELLRDSSVRQIVDLCMKAGDLRTARILFRAIQTPSIKAELLNDHAILRQ
ncbi:MAG: hypothetical protein WDN50_13780 [Bradyrhizobium sp.]